MAMRDVIGAKLRKSASGCDILGIYAYTKVPSTCCDSGGRAAHHVDLHCSDLHGGGLQQDDAGAKDAAAADGDAPPTTQDWADKIMELAYAGGEAAAGEGEGKGEGKAAGVKARKFLAIINPVGGQGKAMQHFTTTIKPMWVEAGIEVVEFLTQHASHATEHMAAISEEELTSYDAVVAMGGDGLLYVEESIG